MTEQNELWKVTGITDVNILVNGRGAVPGKRVMFRTVDGTRSSIEIPDDEFSAERAAELIGDATARIIAVAGLVGPTV